MHFTGSCLRASRRMSVMACTLSIWSNYTTVKIVVVASSTACKCTVPSFADVVCALCADERLRVMLQIFRTSGRNRGELWTMVYAMLRMLQCTHRAVPDTYVVLKYARSLLSPGTYGMVWFGYFRHTAQATCSLTAQYFIHMFSTSQLVCCALCFVFTFVRQIHGSANVKLASLCNINMYFSKCKCDWPFSTWLGSGGRSSPDGQCDYPEQLSQRR